MLYHFIGSFPEEGEIIGIIGPRRPGKGCLTSEINQHQRDYLMAYSIAREAAKKGSIVLSGLASGIDTAAHLGCLEAGGITIAVVPFGLSARVFPPENYSLYQRIINSGGCIVSQFKPDQQAVKWTFVARDKTQAVLANKILVVGSFPPDGIITGGTKHCANWARKLGKPLYHYREIDGFYRIICNDDVKISI